MFETSEDIKNIYLDKVTTKTQEKLLNNILDLINLIEAHKESLEVLGVSNRTVTGTIKVNPSEKSLRECMLQLSKLIKDLDENIVNLKELYSSDIMDDYWNKINSYNNEFNTIVEEFLPILVKS